jgi:protein AbiQ
MELLKLDHSFYAANTHIHNALDNHNGCWDTDNPRGYGVVLLKAHGLKFGIPLRSNITHAGAYPTVTHNKGKGGLDYSKALLIEKPEYISSEIFRIPHFQNKRLKGRVIHISIEFKKYVNRYELARKKKDANILNMPEYRFTTLVHYHKQLGIETNVIA